MPKEKDLEWDYVTVPEPEDDAEGERKGVMYECTASCASTSFGCTATCACPSAPRTCSSWG
eukprot:646435-Pelagomonas_calceolata.AAC.1